MTSSQGTEYYLKSMNGIKSFDDGSGTIIEDDSITVANLTSTFISCETLENTGTFYTPALSAYSLETSFISSAVGNLTIGGDITTRTNISAGSIGTTGPISAGSITTTGNIGATGSISAGSITATGSIGTTGAITAGSFNTTGNIGATGNISGNFINCNKIDTSTPTSSFNFLPSQKGDINIGDGQTGSAIFIGQNKTSGFVLLGSANASTIIKGPLSCERSIILGNTASTQIYSTSSTAPFEIRTDNTLNVIGSGVSKYGSWNGGQVEIGTQSYSNIVIGANGTGTNARTTTINGETLNIGKFILGDQSIQALVNSTATNLLTNLTNLLVIGGLSNMLIGSSSAGKVTQIQGETLRLGQSTGTTTIFGNFISGSSKIFGYNRYLTFGASNNINGVDVDLELYILYTGSAAATFTLPNLNVTQMVGQVIRFKNGKTAGALTIVTSPGQFIFTNTNVTSISVPVLGTATLLCPVGTGWVQF